MTFENVCQCVKIFDPATDLKDPQWQPGTIFSDVYVYICKFVWRARERERQTERERETDRHTDTHTHTHRERERRAKFLEKFLR